MDDIFGTHQSDQMQGKMREFAESLARDVAAYRAVLIGEGVPEDLANTMAERFNDAWLTGHVEEQAKGQTVLIDMEDM